ncbi:MAG: hypothetical protein CSA62_00630 [Planctomycetota bacterium]|nr:MAG: hypothetical protein CSA62_00630 [Planctomycetota bacterium]
MLPHEKLHNTVLPMQRLLSFRAMSPRVLVARFCLVALLCLAGQVGAQHSLFTYRGQQKNDFLGKSGCGLGDLNGDGFADFAIGCQEDFLGKRPGRVRIYSGYTGTVLHEIVGPSFGMLFGHHCARVPDLDRDTVDEIAIAAPNSTTSNGARSGAIRIYSGKSFALIRELPGGRAGQRFGQSLVILGDIDGDGVVDFAAGTSRLVYPFTNIHGVRVVSGRTGKQLYHWEDKQRASEFGLVMAAPGDLDGDAVPDLIVSARRGFHRGQQTGYVRVFSLKSGRELARLSGDSAYDLYGESLLLPGDLNRDGVADFFVARREKINNRRLYGLLDLISGKTLRRIDSWRPGQNALSLLGTAFTAPDADGDGLLDVASLERRAGPKGGYGLLRVFSASSKRLLRSIRIGGANRSRSSLACIAGDVNGDGHDDILYGSIFAGSNSQNLGLAKLWSVRPMRLSADEHHLFAGGSKYQWLQLDAGVAHAGDFFFFVGTASGTKPGLQLGSLHVPIQVDAVTKLYFAARDSLFAPSSGLLDAAGRGTSSFFLPPELSHKFPPLQLWHCFVVADRNTLQLRLASNAVPLRVN